ncbi:alpha/beta hydrolase [Salinisphaera sp. T5B8]|uniref:alpha/beta hydrolase family protein n=1 Tax=Salinisphaera sp. T5B8 TaxID=1304154 RepID=UPI00333FB6EE
MKDLRWTQVLVLACASALVVGCSDSGGSDNDSVDTDGGETATRIQDSRQFTAITQNDDGYTLSFGASSGATVDTDRWSGVMPNGAAYRVEVPQDNWNGMLIMYAHGYRGEGNELTVSNPALRNYYVNNGYAWAASSYSKNYYDVRAGVEDTNALANAFVDIAAQNGRTLMTPTKIYITGDSMGGHVTAAAIEQETQLEAANKVRYAGAVARCGVVGGTYEFDYLLNFTFAAQHAADMGPTRYPATDFNQTEIDAVLWSTEPGFGQQGVPTAAGEKLENIVRTLSGGDRPVFQQGFRGGYYDVVMGTGGRDGTVNGILARNLSGNIGYEYDYDGDPASSTVEETQFNASILRVAADPNANPARSDGVRWIPRVNGQFSVPMVTLHGLGDLYVPFVHEQIYRERARENGNDDLLVQRAVRAPGHCDFTQEERQAAFEDMINWEQNSVKPAGDDVSRTAVADADYGCQFTTADRQGIAACPAP